MSSQNVAMSARAATKTRTPRSLGEAIRAERTRRSWSQSKLARLLETSEKNIHNWESGKVFPSYPLYARMCLLFGWELPYTEEGQNEQAMPS